jgi:hypothetical protein
MVALMTVKDNVDDTYKFLSISLSNDDLGNHPDCVYTGALFTPPTMGPVGHHPHLGPKMAIARGTNGRVFGLSIVPSNDTTYAGAVVAFYSDVDGTGAASWLYSVGSVGMFPSYPFDSDPVAPVAGIQSHLDATDMPVFTARDNASASLSTLGLIYCDSPASCTSNAHWHHTTNGVLGHGGSSFSMGNNLTITNVAEQTTTAGIRMADAIFAVNQHGDLYETRFVCNNLAGACNGGFGLSSITFHGNNGTALDSFTDSLSSSWYHDAATGIDWARAYARIDTSHADTVKSDVVLGNADVWTSGWVPGTSGFGSTWLFRGSQAATVLVGGGTNQDEVYAACSDSSGGHPFICGAVHGWTGTSYAWSSY